MAPAIFSDEDRNAIRVKMLEQGFVSIKQSGYRNTSIADIAKAAGVAKGTFYNFFSSKEQFVAEIMEHRRVVTMSKIKAYCKSKSFETHDDVFRLIKYILSGEHESLYNYLSLEEIIQISSKAPYIKAQDSAVQEVVYTLLELVPNRKKNCDWESLVNYSRIISLLKSPNEIIGFYNSAADKNVNAIIGLMVDEVLP